MNTIADGNYYRKQFGCACRPIAWSHGARFQRALSLLGPERVRLLDYGSGDGTFLRLAADRIASGWGADIAEGQILECRERLGSLSNLRFSTIGELSDPKHDATFDVVTCMETLEHCLPDVVEIVLADLARLVTPTGRVLISVPIEIGPSFLFKYAIRKLAAWRNLSDYRHYESYTVGNALKMIFSSAHTSLERPAYGPPESRFHSHYGFNWRAMRERVRSRFTIERTTFSPLGFLGGWFSSQAWFVCRPKTTAEIGSQSPAP